MPARLKPALPRPKPAEDGWQPPGGPDWKPYALASVMLACAVAGIRPQPQALNLAVETPVVIEAGGLSYLPPAQSFASEQDWTAQELVVRLRVPARNLVASLRVSDAQGRTQMTRWTEGQCDVNNPNYDSQTGVLTLRLQPSRSDVDEHGKTDPGFDPRRVTSLQIFLSPNGPVTPSRGVLRVESQGLRPQQPASPAQIRPLLGHNQGHGQPREGVSQYFVYSDLQRWSEARPRAEQVFRQQQAAGKHAFRLVGGLDLRSGKLSPEVFPATRDYLRLAGQYGQDEQIVALLDGAIPNPALRHAMDNPEPLIEELRPFIREFGNAKINGKPVLFDLVNEIHGTAGPEAAKQHLVERLVETFIQEAPGARLTVGVQNFRELQYWSYLYEKYAGQPVELVMTFHVYEPMANVPDRSELNLPDRAEVGITEADPNAGYDQAGQARQKGYDWMLFWSDASHPYDPRK
ncbi:MAG: hypothetical protein U0931_24740 [Vulcanimicrobiota bacterium]